MHLVVAVVVVLLTMMFVVMWVLKNQFFVATPKQLLVISGRVARAGGRMLGYRTVRGGRALRLPLIERVDVIDLNSMTVALDSFEVRTREGLSVRVNLTAELRMATDQPELHRALECLFGKTREEIAGLARQVIVGTLTAVAAGTAPEDLALHAARLEVVLAEEASSVLGRLGLELERVRIKPDDDDLYFRTLADGSA